MKMRHARRLAALLIAVSILAACKPSDYTVGASAGPGGSVGPAARTVREGAKATFTVAPAAGFSIDSASGCAGVLKGNSYVTGPVTADCTVTVRFAPKITVNGGVKQLRFEWPALNGATHYRLLEDAGTGNGFTPVTGDLEAPGATLDVKLHRRDWSKVRYRVQACGNNGCTVAGEVTALNGIANGVVDVIGRLKASNTGNRDRFGLAVALSADGNTLAIGAPGEDGNSTIINGGNPSSDSAEDAGAVYVFTRKGDNWRQQAYVKATNSGRRDRFGQAVALSRDGNTLAVGAPGEDGGATGIDGNAADNSAKDSGSVYVFTRDGHTWRQDAYVKPSNTGAGDGFGGAVALNGDGTILAAGAAGEASKATGIDGNANDNSATGAGAVYIYARNGGGLWRQRHYLKASNTGAGDAFGASLVLSGNGATLAVGAPGEDSGATGIDGRQAGNGAEDAGAVYLFTKRGTAWRQSGYIKASNAGRGDRFGSSLALSTEGTTLAAGAPGEDSNTRGVDGNQADDSARNAGAVYVYGLHGDAWRQEAYLKASNTAEDEFGISVSLSGDGRFLAAGARYEDSQAGGVNGDQADNMASGAGAAYVYARAGGSWNQLSYVKAAAPARGAGFGAALALSENGDTLAAGTEHQEVVHLY